MDRRPNTRNSPQNRTSLRVCTLPAVVPHSLWKHATKMTAEPLVWIRACSLLLFLLFNCLRPAETASMAVKIDSDMTYGSDSESKASPALVRKQSQFLGELVDVSLIMGDNDSSSVELLLAHPIRSVLSDAINKTWIEGKIGGATEAAALPATNASFSSHTSNAISSTPTPEILQQEVGRLPLQQQSVTSEPAQSDESTAPSSQSIDIRRSINEYNHEFLAAESISARSKSRRVRSLIWSKIFSMGAPKIPENVKKVGENVVLPILTAGVAAGVGAVAQSGLAYALMPTPRATLALPQESSVTASTTQIITISTVTVSGIVFVTVFLFIVVSNMVRRRRRQPRSHAAMFNEPRQSSSTTYVTADNESWPGFGRKIEKHSPMQIDVGRHHFPTVPCA